MAEGRKGFFGRLVEGLAKTRSNIVSGIDSIFSGFSAIDDDFYEEIEETLIMGDLGIQTTMSIVEDLRKKVKEQHIREPEECKELLINSIKEQMDLGENAYEFEHRKSVVLVIGASSGHIRAALALIITVATNRPKHPLAIIAPAPAKQVTAKLHRRSVFMLSQLPCRRVMITSADNT